MLCKVGVCLCISYIMLEKDNSNHVMYNLQYSQNEAGSCLIHIVATLAFTTVVDRCLACDLSFC